VAFAEPIAAFFDTSDFAVAATLNGASVVGIFDNAYFEPLGGDVQGAQPVFTLPTSLASSAAHGQALVIGSTTYKVRGVEPDGTGITMLRLEKQ
jgi:hypothetical protein